MRAWVTVGALLLTGCVGSPEDAFVGRYSGSYECNGYWSSDGADYSEGPLDQTVEIMQRSNGSIFMAGRCSFELSAVTAERADVLPSTCNASAPDGTPLLTSITGGLVEIREPRLSYVFDVSISGAGDTLIATCTFDGVRVE